MATTVTDLRQAPGNGEKADKGDVTVEPASETTTDAPELTAADAAPEKSPAATKRGRRKKTDL